MAFKNKGHMTKFDQLDRFVKQQLDPTTAGAGATSRQRTKQYLALGQAQAEQTALREELNKQLDEMTYAKLVETDKNMIDNTNSIVGNTPLKIFVG